MKTAMLAATLLAAFATTAGAADTARISGAGFTDADRGHALIELLDAKAHAAVITGSLTEAVMDARVDAWTDSHRLLRVPATLQVHDLGDSRSMVTLGEPSAQVRESLELLRAR